MSHNQQNETPLEFAQRVIRTTVVDIDTDYCEQNGVKYENHEIDASDVKLFDKKSTETAFDIVTSLYD
ncbi:MAG: hypothetical protein P8P74_04405 [Crocinitomicaceae bacterium]|nr:hypothetical protein [Crocinitomicaceae bacterium]